MDGGVVQQDAEAQSIFDAPSNLFVAKFFGDSPMNLVHGTLKQERDGVTFSETGDGTIAIRLPAPVFSGANELVGRPIILGFRPEAIEIAGSLGEGGGSPASFRALVDRGQKGQKQDFTFGLEHTIWSAEAGAGAGKERVAIDFSSKSNWKKRTFLTLFPGTGLRWNGNFLCS